MASLKISLLEEMFESRLLMFSGMFFFNAGGDDYSAGGRTAIYCWVSTTNQTTYKESSGKTKKKLERTSTSLLKQTKQLTTTKQSRKTT